MSGNTKGDDENCRGELCPYIFIAFRIIVRIEVHSYATNAALLIKEAASFTPLMNQHDNPQLEHDVLAPWIIKMASPILHAVQYSKMETSSYGSPILEGSPLSVKEMQRHRGLYAGSRD